MESTPETLDEFPDIPMPDTITTPPPGEREWISVQSLKMMLKDEDIPVGARKLFWGYYTKFASLTNLRDMDVDKLMADYDYCCLLYMMKQKQPKAIIDPATNKPLDPIKTIDTLYKEDMYLAQGRSMLFMQLRRSVGALNLQLLAPRSLPVSQQQVQQQPKQPSRWARILGRG